MQNLLKIKWENVKYILLSAITFTLIILLAIAYKNDDIVKNKEKKNSYDANELSLVKEFFFKKIRSPFIDVNYEIKKGDSIQKILKNYKIKNSEIQETIQKYKNIAIQISYW